LTFKKGTDDFRDSPYMIFFSKLFKKGCNITFLDNLFNYQDLIGANKNYVDEVLAIPQIKNLQTEKTNPEGYDLAIIGPVNYFDKTALERYKGTILDLNGLLIKDKKKYKNYISFV